MIIVIAQKEELKLVEELGYDNFPVLITGVGGLNVIRALKNLPKDTQILNIGYCGSKSYKIGTKLEIAAVGTYYEKAAVKEYREGLKYVTNGFEVTHCFTSTDFVTETNKETACVFDMELAFICAMFNNVRSIKVVSDNLNKKDYDDYVS